MVKNLIVVILLYLFISGCASSVSSKKNCDNGQAELDGVCVSQHVADYVACVRSPNSTYDMEVVNTTGGEIGRLAISVKGVSEFKEEIKKKYHSTEDIASKIVEGCYSLIGIEEKNPKKNYSVAENPVKQRCSLQIKTSTPDSSVSLYAIPNDAANERLKIMDGEVIKITQDYNQGGTQWKKVVSSNGVDGWIKDKYISNKCI